MQHWYSRLKEHTDLDIGAFIVGNARVGGACHEEVVSQVALRVQLATILPRSIPIAPSYTGRSAIVKLSGLEIGEWKKVGKRGFGRVEIFINALPHFEKGRKFFGSGESRGGVRDRRMEIILMILIAYLYGEGNNKNDVYSLG